MIVFARKPLLDSSWVFSYTLDAFGLFVYARVAKLADSYLAARRQTGGPQRVHKDVLYVVGPGPIGPPPLQDPTWGVTQFTVARARQQS